MPELPEVETIRQELLSVIKAKKIKSVEVKTPKIVGSKVKQFISGATGEKIINITRRAKLLVFKITQNKNILVHLKMAGQLLYQDKNGKLFAGGHPDEKYLLETPGKFTQVTFIFSDNSVLYFNDIRKFGWLKLLKDKELEVFLEQHKFGPEPLDKEFTLAWFIESLKNKPQKIKPLLMDQKFIAGIGNIYAAESLHLSGIDPRRQAKTLKPGEIKKLFQNIKKVLADAIKYGGTSTNTYVDIYGKKGNFVPRLKVYGRGGEACKKCKTKLKNIKLAQRGTVYCPKCQK